MRTIKTLVLVFWSSSLMAQSADEILQKADEIRAPSESYRMEVSVESSDDSRFRYEIKVGGKESSIIRTLEPAREVGKNFLMLHEDMWAYVPNIKRSLRVTLNQKLTGQAANGDISRMTWVGDYKPTLESQTDKEWVLLLKAERRGLTYDGIRVWVDKSNYRPLRGEYLSLQGKVLKRVEFTGYKSIAGNVRPTNIRIENADRKEDYSILRILDMQKAEFSSTLFTQNNLQ
ncbi:outer membrane lipoprotein-sorting protein [Oligoflexus tunisiensis]|uniref:outer membrane lipoprotein-sorting protein n=1 Tax=Oligoflexus tunisiensis TaxID=708132 RepID=UPI00114CAD84|nr:outer membrane lipoprotein-sorting protein [Oligoflexus tunisiensis]